jgi:hypothetical protein
MPAPQRGVPTARGSLHGLPALYAFGRFQILPELLEFVLLENLADFWKHLAFLFLNVMFDGFDQFLKFRTKLVAVGS